MFGDLFTTENIGTHVRQQIVQIEDATGRAFQLDYLLHSGTVVLYNPAAAENEVFVTFRYGGQFTVADALSFLGFQNPQVGLQTTLEPLECVQFDIDDLLTMPVRALPRCQMIVLESKNIFRYA